MFGDLLRLSAMREQPPAELISLLENLGLATARQVQGVARRARRLAHDLPLFESVWVDALAQARILTPFQAAEINAGRGTDLRIGPYLLVERLDVPAIGDSFRAKEAASPRFVRLMTTHLSPENSETVVSRLDQLAQAGRALDCRYLATIERAGLVNHLAWAACPWIPWRTAGDWLARHGRMPPEGVMEIARQMLLGLCELERLRLLHGDLSVHQLILNENGRVVLLAPGWRGLVRPVEEYSQTCTSPEVYDCLAPERIADGACPSTASDLYAAGCVWWQLLAGRPPLAGGNGLARLQAAQSAKVCDVRRFAPDTPDTLAAAISACTQRDPRRRPESFARLAAMLGPPTLQGERDLARMLSGAKRRRPRRRLTMPAMHWSPAAAGWLIAAGAGLGLLGYVVQDQGKVEGRGLRVERSENPPVSSLPTNSLSLNPQRSTLNPLQSNELLLPDVQPIRLTSLEIGPGQTVRGANGGRPVLVIDTSGLEILGREVHFENIDFVCSPTFNPQPTTLHPQLTDGPRSTGSGPGPATLDLRPSALVRLSAASAEFRGCTFRSLDSNIPLTGICWSGLPNHTSVELPTGQLRFTNCVFQGLAAAVDHRAPGALVVEIDNSLHLGPGPLVRRNRAPMPDEPLLIGLRRFTVRGGGPVLECRYETLANEPGKVTIQATDCAFWPSDGRGLMHFDGAQRPDRLLQNLAWTGSGSVLGPQAPLAVWRQPDGALAPASEEGLEVAGLVRSNVDFAGDANAGPAGSRIVRWQVPLNSSDPPGIDPLLLPALTIPTSHQSPTTDHRPPTTGLTGLRQ